MKTFFPKIVGKLLVVFLPGNCERIVRLQKYPPLICVLLQFDMQRITLEELKHILFYAFRDHLTMKDIENIIINEEESLKENAGNCQTEFEGGELESPLLTSHTGT